MRTERERLHLMRARSARYSGYDLLQKNPHPSEDEVRHALSGYLCRCTGYANIVKAVMAAAGNQD